MRAVLLAIAALLLMSVEAQALCVAVPEASAWQAAQYKTAQTLCLQRELAQATEDRAEQARWNAQLGTLAAQTELYLQQQRAAQMLNRWN